MKRRNFIGTIGSITGTAMLRGNLRADNESVPAIGNIDFDGSDDDFCELLRKHFLLPDDYIYLNTGGIGSVPTTTLENIRSNMELQQVYPQPGHDQDKWLNIKKITAKLLGHGCKYEEIALTGSATEGLNIIINGLPLNRGDEIITSTHEHPALHIPLLNKMQSDGIRIRTFEPDLRNGIGNVSRISKLISDRTKLIIISHVTCTTGQIFPINEIGKLAKNMGVWFALDGAQSVGSTAVSVKESGVDFYAFCGHKWLLGPKRTGGLYVKKELLNVLRPATVGAYSDAGYDITNGTLTLQPTAQRYEYATQNDALFEGLAKSIDLINTIGFKRLFKRNKRLSEMFYSRLRDIPKVKLLSPEEDIYRSSIITFRIDGKDYREVAGELSDRKIRVRVVPEAGLEGIRASFHIYNNAKEVETVADAIGEMAG